MRSAIFGDFSRYRMIIPYWHFGTTYCDLWSWQRYVPKRRCGFTTLRCVQSQNSADLVKCLTCEVQRATLLRPKNIPLYTINLLAPEFFFFLILAHSVYTMWIIQKPNTLDLWNKLHFQEEKNGEYIPCLKYSVPIFVEQIYKMQHLGVIGAVRPL